MSEDKILTSLNRTLHCAPVDVLDQLRHAQVVKQTSHDNITMQKEVLPRESGPLRLIKSRPALSYLSVAAVFILVFSGMFYQFQARALRTVLYLDINPSIAITLNSKEKIIGVDARNDDGKAILEDLSFRGKSLEFITLEIIHRLKSEQYLLTHEDVLLVSVYSKNTQRANAEIERVDLILKDALKKSNIDPIVIMQTMQTSGTLEQLAKNYNITESRLHFIGLLMRFNPNLVLEDLVNMSLQDLLTIAEAQKFDLSKVLTPEVIENTTSTSPTNPAPSTTEPPTQLIPAETTEIITDAVTSAQTTSGVDNGLITRNSAIAIALKYIQGQVLKVEFDDNDDDDDHYKYEVDILVGNLVYEIEINAQTGAIIDVDVDELGDIDDDSTTDDDEDDDDDDEDEDDDDDEDEDDDDDDN